MKEELASSFLKLVASSTAMGAGADKIVLPLLNGFFQVPVFGVPVTVIGAAAVGAGMSLFFGDPIESRRSLFGQVSAATAFGVGAGVLFADAFHLEWAQKNMAMFVMMTAALMRWFLPTVIEKVKTIITEFKLPRKGDPK